MRWECKLRTAPVAHVAISAARTADHETYLMRQDMELRQRVVSDPAQPLLVGRCVLVAIRWNPWRWHMQEGKMGGVQCALDRLCPVALLQLFSHEAVGSWQAAEFQLWHVGELTLPRVGSEVAPHDVAVFSRRVRREPDRFVVFRTRRHIRQLKRLSLQIKPPPVENAPDRRFFVSAEIQVGAAMRTSGSN